MEKTTTKGRKKPQGKMKSNGKYFPEVLDIVRNGEMEGKKKKDIGQELVKAGFSRASKPNNQTNVVNQVQRSEDYIQGMHRHLDVTMRERARVLNELGGRKLAPEKFSTLSNYMNNLTFQATTLGKLLMLNEAGAGDSAGKMPVFVL